MADVSEQHRSLVLDAYREAKRTHPEAWNGLPRVMAEEWARGKIPRAILRLFLPQHRPFMRAWFDALEQRERTIGEK